MAATYELATGAAAVPPDRHLFLVTLGEEAVQVKVLKGLTVAISVCYASRIAQRLEHTGNVLGKTVKYRRCPVAVTVDEIRKRATGRILLGRRGK